MAAPLAAAAAKAAAALAKKAGGQAVVKGAGKAGRGIALLAIGCVGLLVLPFVGLMALFMMMGSAVVINASAAAATTATTCGGGATALAVYDTAVVAQNHAFKGNDLITIVAIAGAESGWNPAPPDRTDPATNTIYRGEWQIGSSIFQGPPPAFGGPTAKYLPSDWAGISDADGNATFSYVLYFNAGKKFTPWTTYNNGAYKNFMVIATTEVSILLASQAGQTIGCTGTACGGGQTALNAYWAAKLAQSVGFVNTTTNGYALYTAVALAGAESGWNPAPPDNINFPGGPTATIDRGEWQVQSTYAWSTTPAPAGVFGSSTAKPGFVDWSRLADPLYNAQSTYFLYQQAGNTFNDFDQATVAPLPQFMNPSKVAVDILLAVEAGRPGTTACPPPPLAPPLKCPSYWYGQGWGDNSFYLEAPMPYWASVPPISSYNLYGTNRWHQGIDISCPGQVRPPVYAIAPGTVSVAGPYCGQTTVHINHGSYTSEYYHLGALSVSAGQPVVAGQQIAVLDSVGSACSTGQHLHFQINNGYGQPGVSSVKGDDPCNYFPAGWIPAAQMALAPYPCWGPTGYQAGLYYYY